MEGDKYDKYDKYDVQEDAYVPTFFAFGCCPVVKLMSQQSQDISEFFNIFQDSLLFL